MGLAKLIETAWQDARYALRGMRRSPGFTAIAVSSLALGIGANTAIFSLINTVMLRMLPVHHPEQLVEMLHRFPMQGEPRLNGFSFREYEEFRDHSRTLSALIVSAGQYMHMRVRSDGAEEQMRDCAYVGGNYFAELGVKPAFGRLIGLGDDRTGSAASSVAVVSWAYWKSGFNLDPGIVGKRIVVDNAPVTIIGVAAREFFGLRVAYHEDVWMPLSLLREIRPADVHSFTFRPLTLVGRLKRGISLEQARVELPVLFHRAVEEETRGAPNTFLSRLDFFVEPAGAGLSFLRDQFGTPLVALFAVVGILLLIACSNIANLMLARATARQRELALRISLGAGRWRLMRQMLTESVLLSLIGSFAGVLLARVATAELAPIISAGLAFGARQPAALVNLEVRIDTRVLIFTAAVALLTGVLFGLAPALRAWASVPAGSLRETGSTGDTRMRRVFSRSLVAAQVALSVVLLSAAGLFIQYLTDLRGASAGFRRDHVLTVTLDPSHSGYAPERLAQAYKDVLDRLNAIPGVRSATLTAIIPVQGVGAGRAVNVEGYEPKRGERRLVSLNWIGSRYFETLGMPLLAGRDFSMQDQAGTRTAIINHTMARHYFGAGNPIGKHVTFDDGRSFVIVGVVGDAKYSDLREPMLPTMYLNAFQDWNAPRHFALRTRIDPAALSSEVARTVKDVLRSGAVVRVMTLADEIDQTIIPERLLAILSGFFGALGSTLAAIGLYGLLAYTVGRRTTEIGVRMALGATKADVIRMVLYDALIMVAAGLACGIIMAFWARRFAVAVVERMPEGNGALIAFCALAMIVVALIAAYVPARRAARLDPMAALRYE